MQEAKKENKKRSTANIYSRDVMFYKLKLDEDSVITTALRDAEGRPCTSFLERTLKCANVTSTRCSEV